MYITFTIIQGIKNILSIYKKIVYLNRLNLRI